MGEGRLGGGVPGIPVATYTPRGDLHFLTTTQGALSVDSGCLVLECGGEHVLPVFPEREVDWFPGDRLVYRDRVWLPGEWLQLEGGFVPPEALLGLALPSRCPDGVTTFAVNPDV